MAKMHTPAMEKIEKKNRKRKKPVNSTPAYEAWKRFRRNKTAIIGLVVVGILILIAIFAPLIAPYDYTMQDYTAMMQAPSKAHLFGTDAYGRDIFSRVIYGTRYSLIIALFCTIAALFSGGLLGIIAGYFGGRVDTIIMRIMDIFQAIPMIMMAMCIVSVLGNGIPQLVAAVMFASMPTMARNNRAAILRVRGSDYIESSEAIGVGQVEMILKHMIPNAMGPIIVQATFGVASNILMIAGLSYIGLGIAPPAPEWGGMLSEAKTNIQLFWHPMVFPGVAIFLTSFSLNVLGDGLRDAFDPKLR